MSVKLWYLYHSGFAVETANCFLVFDYWRDTPGGGLSSGVIDPGELAGKKKRVMVFSSHNHPDHYNPVILGWREALPDMELVLSDDVPAVRGALMAGKNKTYELPGAALRTLESNDEGVAFLLTVDGLCVYHAGDLNWWHWEGEPEAYNRDMGERYRAQIDKLRDVVVDLAFVPVDPRLGRQYAWGVDYLMRAAKVKRVVPMHFGNCPEVVGRLLNDPVSEPYRGLIVPLTERGQTAEL